jgi:hypothetical protein
MTTNDMDRTVVLAKVLQSEMISSLGKDVGILNVGVIVTDKGEEGGSIDFTVDALGGGALHALVELSKESFISLMSHYLPRARLVDGLSKMFAAPMRATITVTL